ncbi:DMT family transporter [Halodesulfovibrio sp.]|uniref:DMT family transporter n=1 Tax=Halodesulfovibrio sp. TaxID=1912772 RepID=UPI0025E0887F|nr:DMT family transporter [Halodesulfovibrio sp.]MCT4627869.1 DMT family transporter [Halodesulfovibrio sp.]
MFENKIYLGTACASLATMLWAGSFVIARLAVGQISPMLLAASCWFIALLILCPCNFSVIKKEWNVVTKFLPQFFFAALTGVAAYSPLSYFAAQTTSAINLSLISVTSPIFIVIISSLMGQKQPVNTWAGCSVALLGSIYLVCNGEIARLLELHFALGDFLMLIAAVGFAIYSLILSKIPEGLSHLIVMTLMAFFAVLLLIPCVLWEYSQGMMLFTLNTSVLFSITFMAIFSSIVAWGTWNIGLKHAGSEKAGMIYYSLPLWSGIFAFAFLDETMGAVHLVSGILIIGGIAWASRTPQLATQHEPSSTNA